VGAFRGWLTTALIEVLNTETDICILVMLVETSRKVYFSQNNKIMFSQ
jgi:hypothetical protein